MEAKHKLFLFYLIILLNIAGVFAGAWYYYGQMLQTPAHLLLFVPDCPLYVLLFLACALGLVIANQQSNSTPNALGYDAGLVCSSPFSFMDCYKNDFFSFLVAVGMAKYGLWTVFVLLFHWQYYSLPAFLPVTVLFVFGHLGMALEGLALLPKKRIGALALCAIIAWFLLNDYMDYAVETVPPIPREGMATVATLTVAASVLLPLAFFAYGSRIAKWRAVAFLRGILD
jgi:uncharacterized membrane protein YpjA